MKNTKKLIAIAFLTVFMLMGCEAGDTGCTPGGESTQAKTEQGSRYCP